eukprot:TRINITY_DN6152_c0_g2_i10.p1 TRINITY_DN6152_c0_g2~~TRINITY_DN6152_c0_g2_i10.p1  ORF type:complete len:395 (+),score=37.02 TRINITY_DN6152_c0_g2_i10:73-1257(+)
MCIRDSPKPLKENGVMITRGIVNVNLNYSNKMAYFQELDNSGEYDSYEMHHLKNQLAAIKSGKLNDTSNGKKENLIENYLINPPVNAPDLPSRELTCFSKALYILLIVLNALATGSSVPLYPLNSDLGRVLVRYELTSLLFVVPAILELPRLHKSIFTLVNCTNILFCGVLLSLWQVFILCSLATESQAQVLYVSSLAPLFCFAQGLFIRCFGLLLGRKRYRRMELIGTLIVFVAGLIPVLFYDKGVNVGWMALSLGMGGMYWAFLYLVNICDIKTAPSLLSLLISASAAIALLLLGISLHGFTFIVNANAEAFSQPTSTILGIIAGSVSLATTIMLLKGVKVILLANAVLVQAAMFCFMQTNGCGYAASVVVGVIGVLVTWQPMLRICEKPSM